MKKILLIAALLLGSSSLFAQGGLTIDNSQGNCGVWVKMLVWDNSSGYPLACQLNSNTFLVPPHAVWTWCSVYDFQGFPAGLMCGMSGPGIYSPGWMGAAGIVPGTTGFQWTDVTFQFNNCSDCNAGGSMSNTFGCGPNCFVGWTTSWVSPAAPTCVNTAQWNPACLLLLGNLILTFHS